MERAEAAEGAAWLQWRKVARKEHKRERQSRRRSKRGRRRNKDQGQIVQEVVAGVKEKVCVHYGEKDVKDQLSKVSCKAGIAHRLNVKKRRRVGENDQMAAQWEEEQKLEEIVEQRRIEGDSFKLEVMRKAPELVVHEHVSQGEGVR